MRTVTLLHPVLIIILVFCSAELSQAQLTITVKMASMPYNQNTEAIWLQNAITASQEGKDSFEAGGGTRSTTPNAYQTDGPTVTNPGLFIASSGFNSWQGQVSPASPFSSQLGNEWSIIIHIDGNGQKFSFWNLVVSLSSTDPNDMFKSVFDFSNNTESYPYVNGENNTTGVDYLRPRGNPLDELDLVIPGPVFDASLMSGSTSSIQMANEEAMFNSLGDFSITATADEYNSDRSGFLGTASNTDSFEPIGVPEASPFLYVLSGGGILVGTNCFRKRKQ